MAVLISLVIPVYNNETYLRHAVNSVLKQSFKDMEIIIVEDGSTDKTPMIADEIAKQDRRVRVIHQENQWIYASFNNGIAHAVGEYVYILNSDDLLRDGALELMGEIVRRYQPDVVWTKVLSHSCDSDQNVLVYDYGNADRLVNKDLYCKGKAEVRKHWSFLFESALAANQANLYRRELMLKHPFRNDVYGADVLFNISVAPDIESFYVCRAPVYDFFLYPPAKGNASNGKYYGYEHEMFNEFYSKYLELYELWGIKDSLAAQMFASMRLGYMGVEISALTAAGCPLTTNGKVRRVLAEYVDDLVWGCAMECHREEELEISVIAGIREILGNGNLKPADTMYFVKDMLDSMLHYEKEPCDLEQIETGVYHPQNPRHIGKCLLGRLKQRRGKWEGRKISERALVIYGAGAHAKTYLPLLEEEWDIIGICDGNPAKAGTLYCKKPVFGPEGLREITQAFKVFITVSSGPGRKQICDTLEKAGVSKKDILEEIL